MGGEGSIQGMIIILRNNKKLLRSRNPFRSGFGFDKLREDYRTYSNGKIESKPISEAERQKIRKKVRENIRKEMISNGIILSVIVLIAIWISVLGYQSLQAHRVKHNEMTFQAKTTKYMFYLEDGDKWLEKGRYHNAVFQYLLARKIYPNEYDINYRLALAYGGWCKYEETGCATGQKVLYNLRQQFPNRVELMGLEDYYKN